MVLTESIILCKINAISIWCIETFYLVTKNTNLESSTIHLVGVNIIEINYNYYITTLIYFYTNVLIHYYTNVLIHYYTNVLIHYYTNVLQTNVLQTNVFLH